MADHSFSIEVAQEYGIEKAIIIKSFDFWLSLNKANDKNFHDGKYWTYNSIKALKRFFPYMTERSIRYQIEGLIKKNVLEKGHYNKNRYDRTIWYTFTDDFVNKSKLILQFCQIEKTKRVNQLNENVEPIPVTNTVTNTDTNLEEKEVKKSTHFIPPSPTEVTEYAKTLDFTLDGEQFCAYYEARGWMLGKVKMKSWKAAVVTWKKMDKKRGKGSTRYKSEGYTVDINDYEEL